jgi:hypothetical protein
MGGSAANNSSDFVSPPWWLDPDEINTSAGSQIVQVSNQSPGLKTFWFVLIRKTANPPTLECLKTLPMSLSSDGAREVRVLWFWKYVIMSTIFPRGSNNLLHRTRSSPSPSYQNISSIAILPASFGNSISMTSTRSDKTTKTTLHPHTVPTSVLQLVEATITD